MHLKISGQEASHVGEKSSPDRQSKCSKDSHRSSIQLLQIQNRVTTIDIRI